MEHARAKGLQYLPYDWPKRWQCALALGVVSALLVGRWLVDPALGNRVAFLPLFIALLPLVLLVRAGPFLAAAVAGLLGTWYLFVPPRMNWRLAESASAVDSVVVITAIAIAAATAWVSRRSMDAREHDRAARRESEERLRFAITAGRLGDWDLDLDTGIARTSWQHDQCFGATEPFKDWSHEKFLKFVHPEDRTQVQRQFDEASTVRGDWDFECRIVWPDGSIHWIEAHGTEYRAAAGGRRRMLGIVREVTERKRDEEQLRRNHETLFNLVHHAPFGVYIVDSHFRLREVGAGARKVFENVKPLPGRDFAEVLRLIWTEPFATEVIGRFRHTLETGEAYIAPATTELRCDLGEIESYDWRIERITLPDGQYGVVCYFHDLSAIKRAENLLKEADRRKDEFLATLAHELRNPLAAIRMALGVVHGADGNRERIQQMSAIVDRQSSQLVRLVEDLLDVSRISRGKIELRRRRVDVREVIGDLMHDARLLCEASGLDLTISLPKQPIEVNADPTRVAQVVNNLLQNACKFTQRGGKVRIEVAREGEDAVVRVADTGIVMSGEQLGRVFEMFEQFDSPLAHAAGGLGIGLPLAKSIIELHNGTIEGMSEGLGQGSEFVVRLAAMESEARQAPAPRDGDGQSMPPKQTARRRILAADDNGDALHAVSIMLQIKGHEVETALDGEEALAKLRAQRPNVPLLDIGMPGLDGYEVARRIRREPWGRDILLIAMTGWGQEKDKREASEAGFDSHLTKPVDVEQLERLIAGSQSGAAVPR